MTFIKLNLRSEIWVNSKISELMRSFNQNISFKRLNVPGNAALSDNCLHFRVYLQNFERSLMLDEIRNEDLWLTFIKVIFSCFKIWVNRQKCWNYALLNACIMVSKWRNVHASGYLIIMWIFNNNVDI